MIKMKFQITPVAPFLLGLLLGTLLLACPAAAQEEDPGFIRSLGTDSAPVENDYYLETSFDNNFTRGHWAYLYGEGLFKLGKDWGLEADFPNLYTLYPLGQFPLPLEPVELMARYEAWHFGAWNDETAGAFSISAGGGYSFRNSQFSDWSVEALGGYRMGRFFLQADYSYEGSLVANAPNELYLDTSLGYRLTPEWFLQAELDFTSTTGPFGGNTWSYVPQAAFQPGDWLFELGESFGVSSLGFTQLLVGRAL